MKAMTSGRLGEGSVGNAMLLAEQGVEQKAMSQRYWTVQDVLEHPHFRGMGPGEERTIEPVNPPTWEESEYRTIFASFPGGADFEWLNCPELSEQRLIETHGLSSLAAKPKLVPSSAKAAKFFDITRLTWNMLITKKMLDLLLEFDPSAIEYVEVELVENEFGVLTGPLYFMLVKRRLNAIDWERSVARVKCRTMEECAVENAQRPLDRCFFIRPDIGAKAMRTDLPTDAHIFVDAYFTHKIFVSGIMRKELERRGIKRLSFNNPAIQL